MGLNPVNLDPEQIVRTQSEAILLVVVAEAGRLPGARRGLSARGRGSLSGVGVATARPGVLLRIPRTWRRYRNRDKLRLRLR